MQSISELTAADEVQTVQSVNHRNAAENIVNTVNEEDSMSTTLSIPVQDEVLYHQTETVSNVSDQRQSLDSQDDYYEVTDIDSPCPEYPKYDAFRNEHFDELIIVTGSETSTTSGHVHLPPDQSD